MYSREQKFFGSFFQKRTACLAKQVNIQDCSLVFARLARDFDNVRVQLDRRSARSMFVDVVKQFGPPAAGYGRAGARCRPPPRGVEADATASGHDEDTAPPRRNGDRALTGRDPEGSACVQDVSCLHRLRDLECDLRLRFRGVHHHDDRARSTAANETELLRRDAGAVHTVLTGAPRADAVS